MSNGPFDPDFLPNNLRQHPDLVSKTREEPAMIATRFSSKEQYVEQFLPPAVSRICLSLQHCNAQYQGVRDRDSGSSQT
jgi:hypothetical protein